KRQRIIECAVDEFAQHDYASASISKIVTKAGIAKGSLYQYFNDKSDLYSYLLDLVSQTKTKMMAQAFQPENTLPFFESLLALFSVMANFELQYPKLAKIGYKAVSGKSPLPEELLIKGKRASIQYFVTLIDQGKANGEIRSDIDAEIAAFIFVSTLSEMGNYVSTHPITETNSPNQGTLSSAQLSEIEKLYRQVIMILKNGIAK
ncbi:MAG: TetR/AcrR family transcriptional regulator, partial [Desulfosalsimonadaceae bacterium]|nr:TetR/AcrR family transcriptional regulator [Desulfosalsimonadaceae bacterium]